MMDGRARSSLLLVALLSLVRPAWAEDTPKKDGGKVGREAGKVVAAGESAAKEFGHDASEAGREALAKAKEVSAAAVDEVRRATHEFWRDVVEEKERLRAKLRQENRELRARQAK
jgi:hypothetical protein